ncbi:MAG: efflux RND transporter periplasmic adaptor subunit [Muribaculaceae bacterium]|nr:efflux RND transporter periplasmic adaptor subunit [Muribaculaceae bacterium]
MKKRYILTQCFSLAITLLLGGGCAGEKDHDHNEHDIQEDIHASLTDKHDKEEGDHHHEGAITLSPHQAEEFGVVVETIQPSSFNEVIKVSGRIEPSVSGRVTVTARKSGIVTLSPSVALGASVKGGSPIATISSKGIQGGDLNAAAIAARDAAAKELERLRPLHQDGLVTTSTLNDAERAYKEATAAVGASAGATTECSSTAGVICALFVSSGDFVETGAPIATIARDSRLTLRADVPERFASIIPGIVSANFRPDSSKEAISLSETGGIRVSPGAVNPAENGYIPVYFTFNSTPDTHPGSFAEIYLIGNDKGNVLSIPRTALVEMQGNYYAYVRLKDHEDAYEKRLVKTAGSDGVRMEIKEGLSEGDQVVVKGATVVRMAETSAIAPPGHSHNH